MFLHTIVELVSQQVQIAIQIVANALAALTNRVSDVETGKVSKTGDTMTGNLNMGTNVVVTTSDPVAGDQLARKLYVDGQDNLRVNKAGDTMTGNLNMGTNVVITTSDPVAGDQLARKLYVDGRDNLKVNKAGDTMTGNLNMGTNVVITTSDPVAGDELARKLYVDGRDNLKVNKAGDTMTGPLLINTSLINSTPQLALQYNGINSLFMRGINNAGDWNPLTQFGDSSIIFGSSSGTGSFVLAPWTSSSSGIRFNTLGNIGIHASDPFFPLDVQGISRFRSGIKLTPAAHNAEGNEDSPNRTQTYITFQPQSGGNDYAFFRDIGFPNEQHLSLDLHDDDNDGRFSIRAVHSAQIGVDVITSLMTINRTNATFNVPLNPQSWSSGQLVKTTVYNRIVGGLGSGILAIPPNAVYTWKDVPYTFLSQGSNIVVMELHAPYALSGTDADEVIVTVHDATSSPPQRIYIGSQRYTGGGDGGGTRSGTILPFTISYQPPDSIMTRIFRVAFENSSDDTLHICRHFDGSGVITDSDIYTIRFSEYKI